MAKIRASGNQSTEIALVAFLRRSGIKGWRRHLPMLGRPDFVFPKARVVVFVDGCFWHGCPVHGTLPKSNRVYWSRKIAANRNRDRLVTRRLRKLGWRVLRVWEHELRKAECIRLADRIGKLVGSER
jgi:DNA mismatch endonuclease (patch repair protein)